MANGDIIHTVAPSGECNLSVDVGDRRTERQTDRQISSPVHYVVLMQRCVCSLVCG